MSKTKEELRMILSRPRARLLSRIDQAIGSVRSSGLVHALTEIKRAIRERPATPREVSLVDAVLLQLQEDHRWGRSAADVDAGRRRSNSKRKTPGAECIRCGNASNLVATVMAGFSCCDGCWRIVSGASKPRDLDVDLGKFSLPIGGSAIGSLDGIELI